MNIEHFKVFRFYRGHITLKPDPRPQQQSHRHAFLVMAFQHFFLPLRNNWWFFVKGIQDQRERI